MISRTNCRTRAQKQLEAILYFVELGRQIEAEKQTQPAATGLEAHKGAK
jgi:hypothetical protein